MSKVLPVLMELLYHDLTEEGLEMTLTGRDTKVKAFLADFKLALLDQLDDVEFFYDKLKAESDWFDEIFATQDIP